MNLAIELPEEIAQHLSQQWDNLPQRILEAIALEAYRSNTLTPAQIQTLLKLPSRWAVEDFLLIEPSQVVQKLRQTNFRISNQLLQQLLDA